MIANRNLCATCRHLKILEVGREFEKILDTEYTLFRCAVLGWETKEFYLMAPVGDPSAETPSRICEFWEDWREGAGETGMESDGQGFF